MPAGGLLTASIIGGASGLLQLGLGIGSRAKGKRKLREAESFYAKNKYDIPESARSALGVAERQASGVGLPGEDLYRARLGESTAAGVGAAKEAATSASDVLSVLSSLYGGQMQGEQDIALEAARRYDVNQANLQQALGTMAGFEERKWNYNVYEPYKRMLGQAEAYQQRGSQEISSGLGTLGGVAGGLTQVGSAQQGLQGLMSTYGINPQGVADYRLQQSRVGLGTINPNTGYVPPTLNTSNMRSNLLPFGG